MPRRPPLKRAGAAVAGGLLLVLGAAALVLPGPGFVLLAAGFAILATQFEWARRPLDYARGRADDGLDQVTRDTRYAVLLGLCAAGLLGVGVLGVLGVDIPFLTVLSGVLLLASGAFLVGTLVYARSGRGRLRYHQRARARDAATSA